MILAGYIGTLALTFSAAEKAAGIPGLIVTTFIILAGIIRLYS